MVWTIASIWLAVNDRVHLIGEFPTQAKCIAALRHKASPGETPPDIHQCVQVSKEVLHRTVTEDNLVYERVARERQIEHSRH